MSATPKTIRQKLDGIPDRIKNEEGFGELLASRSIQAILDGPRSPAWISYMTLIISSNPNSPQLHRLTVFDATTPGYVKTSSAYIVANGACGPGTGGQTGNGVDSHIDDGLQPEL